MKYSKKYIQYSIVAILGTGSFAFAGGEMDTPVEVDTAVDTYAYVEENEKTNFYAGLGLEVVFAREASESFSFSDGKGLDRIGNVALLAGYSFHENFALEGRYTTSVAFKDSSEMSGFSIFAKPQYEVGAGYTIYALIGYGNVKLDGATTQDNVDVDENGFQWGLGVNYDVNENLFVSLDYTSLANDMDGRYLNDTAASVDAITLGINYRF